MNARRATSTAIQSKCVQFVKVRSPRIVLAVLVCFSFDSAVIPVNGLAQEDLPPPPPPAETLAPPTAPTDLPPPPPLEEPRLPPPDGTLPPPPPPDVPAPPLESAPLPALTMDPNDPNALPPIDARTFPVTVTQRSRSYRVYMIEDKNTAEPKEGRILLLKRGAIPIMGLRVLKLYPEKRSFAAKRVQIYDNRRVLDVEENYLAIEKLGDLAFPAATLQDQSDLRELEGGPSGGISLPPPPPPASDLSSIPPPPPPPQDPEVALDPNALPPPPPPPPVDDGSDPAPEVPLATTTDALELESHNSIVVEEPKPFDPFHQWISAGGGVMANFDTGGGLTYYMGGGARYGVSVGKGVFINSPRIQDSIVLEAGASVYSITGYANADSVDSYMVLPVTGALRYNFQFSENFGLFLYGGVMKNFVVAATSPDITGITNLNSLVPAGGLGAYLQIGPGWHLRADLGYDTFAASLMLKF